MVWHQYTTGRCPYISPSQQLSVIQYMITESEYLAYLKCGIRNHIITLQCGLNNAWDADISNLCNSFENTTGIHNSPFHFFIITTCIHRDIYRMCL